MVPIMRRRGGWCEGGNGEPARLLFCTPKALSKLLREDDLASHQTRPKVWLRRPMKPVLRLLPSVSTELVESLRRPAGVAETEA